MALTRRRPGWDPEETRCCSLGFPLGFAMVSLWVRYGFQCLARVLAVCLMRHSGDPTALLPRHARSLTMQGQLRFIKNLTFLIGPLPMCTCIPADAFLQTITPVDSGFPAID